MDLPVLLVAGLHGVWDPSAPYGKRWRPGKCWRVWLDRDRMILIPFFALRGEVEPGKFNVVLDLIDCQWSRDFFNEEHRRWMKENQNA